MKMVFLYSLFGLILFLPLFSYAQIAEVTRDCPPSKFIGILGDYNGYPNGKLLGTNTQYSGHWARKSLAGNILIEGDYLNGIPTGIWSMGASGTRVATRVWYGMGGDYQQVSYHFDMMPSCVERGTYTFDERGHIRKVERSIRFDPVGRVIPTFDGPENPNGMRKSLFHTGGGGATGDNGAAAHPQWDFHISDDFSFVFYVFLLKEETVVNPDGSSYGILTDVVGKCLFDGYLDFQKRQVKIENTFNAVQKNSIEFKFRSEPNSDRQSLEILFVSEGAYPCNQTFQCDGIRTKPEQ